MFKVSCQEFALFRSSHAAAPLRIFKRARVTGAYLQLVKHPHPLLGVLRTSLLLCDTAQIKYVAAGCMGVPTIQWQNVKIGFSRN